MTLGDVRSQARKLHRKSVMSKVDIPLRWWVAALYAQYLFPESEFLPDTPMWTLKTHELRVRVLPYSSTYDFYWVTPDQYAMLGDCDRILFVTQEGHTTRIHAKWVDVKVVKDTANHFHTGERHEDAQRPFNSDRWVIEATHLNDVTNFTPESV